MYRLKHHLVNQQANHSPTLLEIHMLRVKHPNERKLLHCIVYTSNKSTTHTSEQPIHQTAKYAPSQLMVQLRCTKPEDMLQLVRRATHHQTYERSVTSILQVAIKAKICIRQTCSLISPPAKQSVNQVTIH